MATTYQNPIITFKTTDWERYQVFCIRLNLFANKKLPKKILHYMNASKSIREWREAEEERIAKRKENTRRVRKPR